MGMDMSLKMIVDSEIHRNDNVFFSDRLKEIQIYTYNVCPISLGTKFKRSPYAHFDM